MDEWTGGLPPAAHERIERQRASGTAGSLLSAPAAAALQSAGLTAVGEVFGCLVMNLGWTGIGCGLYGYGGLGGFGGGYGQGGYGQGGGYGNRAPFGNAGAPNWSNIWNGQGSYQTPVITSGDPGGSRNGFGPYVEAYRAAWDGALNRMLTEAAALGAEGVVGVTMNRARIDGQAWEYTATGTAVRSVDATLVSGTDHGRRVWSTDLTAEDCAAAILSSLVPRGLVMGLSVSTKHEDWQLKQQRSSWSNTEVDGMTELIQAARHDARAQLTTRARSIGGSDLVISQSWVGEFETACGEEQDLHAEAVFVGTILAPGPMSAFRSNSKPGTGRVLTVIPLTDATSRPRR